MVCVIRVSTVSTSILVVMSLLRWFSSASNRPSLPDSTAEKSKDKQLEIERANEKVLAVVQTQLGPRGRKRGGSYAVYSAEMRAKIGKFAAESGNKAAVVKFSRETGKPVSESTVRGLKKSYCDTLKRNRQGEPVTRLEHGLRGRPLKLGNLDAHVQDYIRKLRLAGGIINRAIVIAAATGIVEHHNSAMLREHGGPIELGKKWADSILSRINLVKRKGTKVARKVPTDFVEIKLAFLKRITDFVREHKIPPELILNWDQTGAKFVPTSEWTLAEEGSRQVDIVGKEDKREMTVLLTCVMSGSLLPPQLIYAGKTNKCHPDITFPSGWDIYHSETHWSTENTMLHFIDHVLVPYIQTTRETLGFDSSQHALALFDVFAAHRCDSVLQALERNNIKCCFIPANCTGELQPLDVTVNQMFKLELKACFTKWYAGLVKEQLEHGVELGAIKPDLRISILKPLHARWLMEAIAKVRSDVIVNGFEKSGIKESIVY